MLSKFSIDEILEKLNNGYEIKILKNDNPDLTEEEKQKIFYYFEKLIKKHAEKLGDFSYMINTKLGKMVVLQILDFSQESDVILKKLPIYQKGKILGTTCYFCSERVRCVAKDEPPCSIENEFSKEYIKNLKSKIDISHFQQDVFIDILEKEGFIRKKFLGIDPIDCWEKENMTVYLN